MSDDLGSGERHLGVPGPGRVLLLVAGAAIALGIGWVLLYVVYRYLGSDW